MTSAVPATQGKKTIYVGGLAEEVDEKVYQNILFLIFKMQNVKTK